MAWSTPLTATANSPLTAAQWNSSVRDNLNLTPAALATVSGSIFAGNGTNTIAERIPADHSVDTSETIGAGYASAATNGPVVTVTSGTSMLVSIGAWLSNDSANGTYASYELSGATTVAAGDARSILNSSSAGYLVGTGRCFLQTGVTPGSNTVRMLYRTGGGTGTIRYRRLTVLPL